MAKVKASFMVEKSLLARFRNIAKERGHTMTWYVVNAITQVVERKGNGGEGLRPPADSPQGVARRGRTAAGQSAKKKSE